MKLRKSKVSMAVAATLGLACLAPSASFGSQEKYSVNTVFDAGTLNTSSGGDTLLFPFYTVANGAVTNFSVTNSSSTQVVAAKIRFREQLHSVDVLDFHVIFSPNDKFDFWVANNGPNGRPMMYWNDNSCIVGPPSGATSVEFPEAWKPFVETDAQMQIGHVEVLGVVDLSRSLLKSFAIHTNGVPRNCQVLTGVFKSPTNVKLLNDEAAIGNWSISNNDLILVDGGYGDLNSVGNVLMGRYIVTIPGQGMEAGGDAIAIRDTNMADPINSSISSDAFLRWHITAQSPAMCSAQSPSNCRTTELYAWDQQEWSHPHLGEMYNLAGFQRAMGARWVAGDWSNNPDNRVGVDWMLSFPSKYAYMDYIDGSWVLLYHPRAQDWIAGAYPYSDGVWPAITNVCLFNGIPELCGVDTNLRSAFSVYGTEENSTSGVSPGDPTLIIPNETNIFTLQNTALPGDPLPSVIQSNGGDGLSRTTVAFNLPNTPRGWAKMTLQWPAIQVVDFDPKYDSETGLRTLTPGSDCTPVNGATPGLIYADLVNNATDARVPDKNCDDLYNSVFDAGEPGVAADYPRPYLLHEPLDTRSDPVNCTWSPDLCTPASDAVTGIIFTTRATSDPTQNDATLTELQKNQ